MSLDKQRILQALQQDDLNLHIFNEIDSTNAFVMQHDPQSDQLFCCAETQTHGRGRFGKSWHSPFGENIYLSGRWHWSHGVTKLAGLSLVVSLALLQVLNKTMPAVDLACKWPNDIIWQDKKLAGVLIEIQTMNQGSSQVTIGIGLNVNSKPLTFAALKRPCCSMHEITGSTFDRNLLIAALIKSLQHHVKLFAEQGFAVFANEWHKVDYLYNKHITVHLAAQQLSGIAKGVNILGQLQLDNERGEIITLSSGETSIGGFVPS